MDKDAILSFLFESLKKGTRIEYPFPITIFQPFTPEVYEEILENIPDEQAYTPLMHRDALRPDGSSTRKLFSIQDHNTLEILPTDKRNFWIKFNQILTSYEFCDIFIFHMKKEIEKQFNLPINKLTYYPKPRLGRDVSGYKILPHPDVGRVFTAQIYLPKDDSQIDLGTSIYIKLDSGKFEKVKTLEYLPNKGFCFVPRIDSYHGVDPIKTIKARHNLHISCFR